MCSVGEDVDGDTRWGEVMGKASVAWEMEVVEGYSVNGGWLGQPKEGRG